MLGMLSRRSSRRPFKINMYQEILFQTSQKYIKSSYLVIYH